MLDNFDNDAGDGSALTESLVNDSGKKTSRWVRLRCVIISVAIFSSNKAEEASEQIDPGPEGNCVIDIDKEDDWKRVVRIVRDKDLHNLQRLGNVDYVDWVRSLQRSYREQDQADDGHTQVWKASIEKKGFSYFLLHALNSYTIYTLFVTFGLLLAIEMIQQGPEAGWHNGAVVLIAIFVLVAFTSVANFYHERKMMESLLNDNKKMKVNVERNGEVRSVIIYDVKERDIVRLKEGDHVPADGLFIDGEDLTLDDVFNSKITRDQNPFLYAGSKVMVGSGSMIVTSLGAETALGEIPSMIQDPNRKTLLQALLDKPYEFMEKLALFISVLILFVVLIRLPLSKKHNSNNNGFPEIKGHLSMKFLMSVFERIFLKPEGKISSLVSALVRLVIWIQHGAPFVIGVCLTHWNTKLASKQIEPRNLSACGTMGLITVIFFDATGEVLCKPVEVEEFWFAEKDIIQEGNSETDQMVLAKLRQGIGPWLVPKISDLSQRNDLPISSMKSKCGWSEDTLADNEEIIRYKRSFSSKKSYGVLIGNQGNDLHLHWKGPASTILEMCTHFFDSRGELHVMENNRRELFETEIERMEGKGLRPVAFAFTKTEEKELKKEGLSLLAIAGLKYPCKEEIRSLVGSLRNAGLTIKLVSEDELPIARAIAWDLGVLQPDGSDHLRTSVMGDFNSKDKLLMVKQSQETGEIVAFCGGFTARDILALRKADLGITHGRCSEMAREFSDISMEKLYSLTVVWKYGRCVYQGIQKFYELQLTAWISGFLISLATTMESGDSPLTSLQMIWVNLILYLLGGLMMVMEFTLPTNSIPEAKRNQSLITKSIWANIAVQVSYQFSLVLLIFQFMDKDMIFTIFTLCQLFNLFRVINLAKMEVVKIVLQSYSFLVALGAVLLIQVLAVQFGEGVLSGAKLTERKWTLCFLLAALSLVFDWTIKRLFFFLQKHSSGSYFRLSNGRPWYYFHFCFIICFMLFLP